MKTAFVFFLLLEIHLCFSQQLQNGLILPPNYEHANTGWNFAPDIGFSIYDQPEGKKIGTLTKKGISKRLKTICVNYFIIRINEEEIPVNFSTLCDISFDNVALTYFERKNGFVRVICDTVDYWLSEKEIIENKFSVTNWQEFLIKNHKNVVGYFADGLNLRDKPSTEGRIIKTLQGNLHQIYPTSHSKGLWTKAKVIKYNSGESDRNKEYELEGWIKMLDDSGLPNVTYSLRW